MTPFDCCVESLSCVDALTADLPVSDAWSENTELSTSLDAVIGMFIIRFVVSLTFISRDCACQRNNNKYKTEDKYK